MTVPAHDSAAERAVLGAILSAASYGVDAGWTLIARARRTGLVEKEFFSETNGALYALLLALSKRGVATDPLSVAAAIDDDARRNVGPLATLLDPDRLWQDHAHGRLLELAHEVTSFGAIEHHCGLVRAAARERRRQEAGRT